MLLMSAFSARRHQHNAIAQYMLSPVCHMGGSVKGASTNWNRLISFKIYYSLSCWILTHS